MLAAVGAAAGLYYAKEAGYLDAVLGGPGGGASVRSGRQGTGGVASLVQRAAPAGAARRLLTRAPRPLIPALLTPLGRVAPRRSGASPHRRADEPDPPAPLRPAFPPGQARLRRRAQGHRRPPGCGRLRRRRAGKEEGGGGRCWACPPPPARPPSHLALPEPSQAPTGPCWCAWPGTAPALTTKRRGPAGPMARRCGLTPRPGMAPTRAWAWPAPSWSPSRSASPGSRTPTCTRWPVRMGLGGVAMACCVGRRGPTSAPS